MLGPVLRVAPIGGKHGQFVGRGDYEDQQRQDYEDPYGRVLYRLNRATPANKIKQSAIQSHQGTATDNEYGTGT
jgi:hypothetical protein